MRCLFETDKFWSTNSQNLIDRAAAILILFIFLSLPRMQPGVGLTWIRDMRRNNFVTGCVTVQSPMDEVIDHHMVNMCAWESEPQGSTLVSFFV
ncbi:hypothetical protein M433DRAFT_477134 [Acidomyces richmondensis BFW]|nr:MAG: hypothetical protein FE78DRAFT_276757 [Acidomyces sp. 'richmondensis']KYG47752.1 hypothetical protein M433DRAFT_477134 [Acidomyces richmondensis BFW]